MHLLVAHLRHGLRKAGGDGDGFQAFEPFGLFVPGELLGIVDQSLYGDLFLRQYALAAEEFLRQAILGVDLLGAFEIAMALFLTALQPERSQEKVGLEAVGQRVEQLLTGVGCLHNLMIPPIGLGESDLKVAAIGLFLQEGAQFVDRAAVKVAAQIEARHARAG